MTARERDWIKPKVSECQAKVALAIAYLDAEDQDIERAKDAQDLEPDECKSERQEFYEMVRANLQFANLRRFKGRTVRGKSGPVTLTRQILEFIFTRIAGRITERFFS